MNDSEALKKYKQIDLSTSTRKTQQVVMLYEGAIKFMNIAKKAIEDGDLQERFNNTEKASKIIEGLHCCLDPKKGGEVTVVLDKFYTRIFMQIIKLNSNNSIESCTKIIDDLKQMKEAWVEVDLKTQKQIDTPTRPRDDGSPHPGLEVEI